jgi:transposase
MMAEKRQTDTAELTREAVRLVTTQGYGVAEAARNQGINATTLVCGKREHEAREDGAFPGQGRLSPAPGELHRLREGNRRLRMPREMLKKAAAFFANEPR